MKVSPLKCTVLLAVNAMATESAVDTDPEVAVNFTNISIQQPTDSDSTVTNIPSFSIGQCVNVGMHWLGCVAVYLSLKTCRDDLFV